jgi:hypothetical protein
VICSCGEHFSLQDIAEQLEVSTVPVFLGFNRGDPVKRAGGNDPSGLIRLVQSLRREEVLASTTVMG